MLLIFADPTLHGGVTRRSGQLRRRSAGMFREGLLFILALTGLLYAACDFAVWNWLPKYLISQGVPEKTSWNILRLGFAFGLLIGRVTVAPVLIKVRALTVTTGAAAYGEAQSGSIRRR